MERRSGRETSVKTHSVCLSEGPQLVERGEKKKIRDRKEEDWDEEKIITNASA